MKPSAEQKTEIVSARITKDEANTLNTIAKKYFNGKKGTLLRLSIEEFLDNNNYCTTD